MKVLAAVISVLFFLTLYLQIAEGKGVTKCYVCSGNCTDPPEYTCTPDITDWICQSIKVTKGDKIVEAKGCVLNNEATKKACEAIDDADTDDVDSVCYTCDSDLCNAAGSAGIYSISAFLLASLFFLLMKM